MRESSRPRLIPQMVLILDMIERVFSASDLTFACLMAVKFTFYLRILDLHGLFSTLVIVFPKKDKNSCDKGILSFPSNFFTKFFPSY